MKFIQDLINFFKSSNTDDVITSNNEVLDTTDHYKSKRNKKNKHKKNSYDSYNNNATDDPAVLEARARAKEIILDAKDKALRYREKVENELRKTKEKSLEIEKDLAIKKAKIENSEKDIESKTKTLRLAKESIEKKQKQIDEMYAEQKKKLESISTLNKEEAKKMILENLDKDLSSEKGKKIRVFEEELKRESDKISKQILVDAMEFSATDVVVERSTSKVKLPDEDLRGRIIGKEGRNIKAFEELTGVELDLDSGSTDITISSFDSVRREIAKVSLEKLLVDGRIQPARIEEVVEKTTKEIEKIMFKAGDDLCHKIGVYSLDKELVAQLGKFKYRYSYGQNMIEHTLETARIGIYIATKLNADVETVKMGCLLHDIGKIITDVQGSHVDLGVDLLKKYKIAPEIIACVEEHHSDQHSSIESAIVALSDHISGARPGSRNEDYEAYIKRLKDLEETALSFDGVKKAHALSAGRELRVFVSPKSVDDDSTLFLAREIAKKIELEQTYPGVVKVTVIRETRVTETAR